MSAMASYMIALVAGVAITLAVASAYPAKDGPFNYNEQQYPADSLRSLDAIGNANLLRDLDALRTRAAMLSRNRPYQHLSLGDGRDTAKRTGCCDSLSGIGIGGQKRNGMDEIDLGSFNSFVKKNFDEIDRSGFGSFAKKNFDEIDRSGFGFVKRSVDASAPEPRN